MADFYPVKEESSPETFLRCPSPPFFKVLLPEPYAMKVARTVL